MRAVECAKRVRYECGTACKSESGANNDENNDEVLERLFSKEP